jgi:hypothetical protein
MVKNPSKYDNAVFTGPQIVKPKTVHDQLVSDAANESGLQELVDEIACEVREWLKIDKKERSKAATQTGEALLLRCESILRNDFGPVGPSGLRLGPPLDREIALVQLGYHHCQWRIQAYGVERLAGIGARQAMTKWTEGTAIPSEAVEMLKAGETYEAVAKKFGVSSSTVKRWRRDLGLPARKRGVRKK